LSGQEGRLGVLRHVLSHLGVGTERADFDTAGRDGAVRVDLFIIGVAYMARVSFHTEEGSERCRSGATDHDGEERILEGLIRLLRHDVDTGQPAAVSRMGVVPSDNVFGPSDLLTDRHSQSGQPPGSLRRRLLETTHRGGALDVLNHELVGFVGGVDAGLSSNDGERKGVHDDEGVAVEFPLHQAHDFVLSSRARMHDLRTPGLSVRNRERPFTTPREEADHFDEGDGRDADFFEVMRVLFPGSGVELGLLSILVVLVELVGLFQQAVCGVSKTGSES
jgi:hypothetical protein